MNAILYHQKIGVTEAGKKRFLGEDAYPYADNELLIVADGLGGRGGFPHQKINKKILDKDKFFDVCFDGVFDEDVSDEYKEFVLTSFSEVFETSEYYFDELTTVKTSGYFASRFVTAIVLYEFKHGNTFDRKEIFEKVRSAKTEEEKNGIVKEVAKDLAKVIETGLKIIARNVNLEIETKMAGTYLLPSTLITTLIDETENGVDAIYLWAGDSRSYVWDKNGLGQITEDHEKGEVMTNLISLSKDFVIESRIVSFEKPCMLFNASDGCYKCTMFASPFDLEYIFNDAIVKNDSFDNAMLSLYAMYKDHGKHDDSNTLALTTFGYDSYEDVQKAVMARMEDINENIVGKLPDILERDYTGEKVRLEADIANKIDSIRGEAIECDGVISFVKQKIQDEGYAPYKQEADEFFNSFVEGDCPEKKTLINWVSKRWIYRPYLRRYSPVNEEEYNGEDPYAVYKNMTGELDECNVKHEEVFGEVCESFSALCAEFSTLIETLKDMRKTREIASDIEKRGEANEKINKMMDIIDLVTGAITLNGGTAKEYNEKTSEIQKYNFDCATDELEAVCSVVDSLIDGQLNLEKVYKGKKSNKIRDDIARANQAIEACREYAISSEQRKQAELEKIADKYVNKYWNANSRKFIKDIWADSRELLSKELVERVTKELGEAEAK